MITDFSSFPVRLHDGIQYLRTDEAAVVKFISLLLPGHMEQLNPTDIASMTSIERGAATKAMHVLSNFGLMENLGCIIKRDKKIYFKANPERIWKLQSLLSTVRDVGFDSVSRTAISVTNLAVGLGRSPTGRDEKMQHYASRGKNIRDWMMTNDRWISTYEEARSEQSGSAYVYVPTKDMYSVATAWRSITALLEEWRSVDFIKTKVERTHLRLVSSNEKVMG